MSKWARRWRLQPMVNVNFRGYWACLLSFTLPKWCGTPFRITLPTCDTTSGGLLAKRKAFLLQAETKNASLEYAAATHVLWESFPGQHLPQMDSVRSISSNRERRKECIRMSGKREYDETYLDTFSSRGSQWGPTGRTSSLCQIKTWTLQNTSS